jgi:hypothetical protein
MTAPTVRRTIAAAMVLLPSAGVASGQGIVVAEYPPVTSYYPAERVVEYAPTIVSSYYAPRTAFYATPSISYYLAPVASYYPGSAYSPGSVTTVRYGVFGRPRVATTYAPAYVLP